MQIKHRGIIVHPEELTAEWISKMADAGLDTLGLHPVGGGQARESLERAVREHGLPESKGLREEAVAKGIDVEYEAHVMSWLLPSELFGRVPEWFRMNEKGERSADFNLCVSNGDALGYIAERAAHLASMLDTGANKYFYWLDDVAGGSCHCPECSALSPADQQLRTVNALLGGLKSYKADAKLCYLAYCDALSVPVKTEPAEGVFLEYAPIRRNHYRPMDDPDCAENVRESAPLRDLLAFFGQKDSRALEYWMDNSLFSGWKKPPKKFELQREVMKRDVEFYDKTGFDTVTSFGCYLGQDYEALYGEPPLGDYGAILRGAYRK